MLFRLLLLLLLRLLLRGLPPRCPLLLLVLRLLAGRRCRRCLRGALLPLLLLLLLLLPLFRLLLLWLLLRLQPWRRPLGILLRLGGSALLMAPYLLSLSLLLVPLAGCSVLLLLLLPRDEAGTRGEAKEAPVLEGTEMIMTSSEASLRDALRDPLSVAGFGRPPLPLLPPSLLAFRSSMGLHCCLLLQLAALSGPSLLLLLLLFGASVLLLSFIGRDGEPRPRDGGRAAINPQA